MAAAIDTKGPTERLEWEHRCIQKVVGAMAPLAETLERGGKVEVDTLTSIVEFMRTFADKCHHGKEEKHLFTKLEAKGVPTRGCPLAILYAEHQSGRVLVTKLAELTDSYAKQDPAAGSAIAKCLHDLMNLYPNHIWKEEYLLFPMSNKILAPGDQTELSRSFEAVEEAIGIDVHHRLERVADKLASDSRVTKT